jgi:hypothetical protein
MRGALKKHKHPQGTRHALVASSQVVLCAAFLSRFLPLTTVPVFPSILSLSF